MDSGHVFRRVLTSTVVACCALTSTGCLHYLGKAQSSLSPRTASLDAERSTFRSQDRAESPSSAAPGYAGSDGHGIRIVPRIRPTAGAAQRETDGQPRARLLGVQLAPSRETTHMTAQSRKTASKPAESSGHSIGLTADALRAFMNRRSANDMSTGQVLANQTPQWQVLKRRQPAETPAQTDPVATETEFSPGVPATSENAPSIAIQNVLPKDPTDAPPVVEEEFPAIESEAPAEAVSADAETPPVPEAPTMLDRLKGIYENPRESSGKTRSIWRRPFQSLQSPWSVFRDREEEEAAEEALQTAEIPAADTPDAAETVVSNGSGPLDALIGDVQQRIGDWPRLPDGSIEDVAGYQKLQQDLSLLHVISDNPGDALASIEAMDGREQEFWQETMLALVQYRTTADGRTREARLTSTINQLRSAMSRVAPLTTLSIRRLEICSRIYSFGRIEGFPSNDFDPGQPILVYAELDNFGTELTPGGTYRTATSATLQIFQDGNSEPIETVDLPLIGDEATSERRDYFQSYEMNLPSHLATGRYHIRLRVRDLITGRSAENAVDFQVR